MSACSSAGVLAVSVLVALFQRIVSVADATGKNGGR